ncbi:MAG: ATP-binding cassette domain-containing protein [Deltaproteobacteria bacterium]|nr:ATP-binding cassette domain-containing protein [Deltaproteobacteria bacterium]
MIEFKNVVKSFEGKSVIDGMSFSVNQGETFCVIGGSGTGKSVTLKLLLGLLPVDAGEVYFKEQLINDLDELKLNRIRQSFGMVFQGSALFDSMTVFENVAYPLYELNKYNDEEIERIVREKLAVVDLVDTEDLYPADLSGGMRKRIGVARALATDPQVILYDEPTAGLDPANVNRIDHLILNLQKRFAVTSILVTHNMESVYRVADRVALLHNKKIGYVGTLKDFQNTANVLVRQFVDGELGAE